MRRIGILSLMAAALSAALATTPAQAATVKIVVNNFRFCQEPPCGPQDQGYVRSSEGGSMFDNPAYTPVTVKVGDRVVWTYMDQQPPGCDTFDQCSGHEVRFENGRPAGGKRAGFMPARKGAVRISWVVPKSMRGKTIYYFCNINNHWQFGLTGILKVAK